MLRIKIVNINHDINDEINDDGLCIYSSIRKEGDVDGREINWIDCVDERKKKKRKGSGQMAYS
jgi:hypothetical protein